MENNEYSLFLDKQNQIYNNGFSGKDIKEEGSKPSKIVLNPIGEYIIAIRHPSEVNEKIAMFVERINSEIPSVKYAVDALHTSITTYGQTPVESVKDFQPDQKILEKIVKSTLLPSYFSTPEIVYVDWAFNNNTVIVKGTPTYSFIDLAKKIVDLGKEQGLELRMPWGAHITATRFSEEMSPKELEGFFKLMREAPKMTSGIASFLDAGYLTLDKNEFKLFPVERRILN